jgi:hypothetical protein
VRRPDVPEKRATSSHGIKRFTLGSGPLKRNSDRLQFLARVLVLCSLVMAVPPALAVATVTHSRARVEATTEAEERQQVRATLQEDAAPEFDDSGNVLGTAGATVVWTVPSGMERKGRIDVPVGARAGASLPIWVDRKGDQVQQPLDDGDVVTRTVAQALFTYVWIMALVCAAYVTFRMALDRSRLRRWATDWAAVEPQWRREML